MVYHNFIVTWSDTSKPQRMFSVKGTDWDKARDRVFDNAWDIGDVAIVQYWGTSADDLSGDLPFEGGLRDSEEVLAFISSLDATHH